MKRIIKTVLILVAGIAITGLGYALFQKVPASLQNRLSTGLHKILTSHSKIVAPSVPAKEILMAKLAELEVQNPRSSNPLPNTLKIDASVPQGKPWELIIYELDTTIAHTPFKITDCLFDARKQKCEIICSDTNPTHSKILLDISRSTRFSTNAAKLAIVIYNFDFKTDQISIDFLGYSAPLTFSISAKTPHADRTAQFISEHNKEMIALIPMEPLFSSASKRDESILMVHYPDNKIIKLVDDCFKFFPNAKGVSNCWNSRVLENSRAMKTILLACAAKKVWYLETRENTNSCVQAIATAENIPFCQLDIQISADATAVQCEKELRQAISLVLKKGKLILQLPQTGAAISALNACKKAFEHNGIKLVFVSEII